MTSLLFHRASATVLAATLALAASAQTLPTPADVKTLATPDAREPASVEARTRPQPTSRRAAPVKPAAGERSRARSLDLERPVFDTLGDGALWAHGTTYKARFDGGSFTYIPFFGSKAPRNFPLDVRVESVRVGERALEFGVASAPQRHDDRVVVAHGAFDELYDVDLDGVKQEFVFAALPHADPGGDLTLRLAVATELEPREGADGVLFENDLGCVSYSRALALDAAGRTLALDTRWNDGAIEIVVPQAFLRDARFPLSIDPVFRSFSVDASSNDDSAPDAAFDVWADAYGYCWERAFSATDHDIWFEQRDDQGASISGTFTSIDFTTDSWARPRIASSRGQHEFLVVAQVGDPLGGARAIKGRRIRSEAPFAADPQQTISGNEQGDKHDPDVGGDLSSSSSGVPAHYCVVWTRTLSATDSDIHHRILWAGGGVPVGSPWAIDNSAATKDGHPSISKTCGDDFGNGARWYVAWERELSSTDSDIRAAILDHDGFVVIPSFNTQASPSADRRPSVSSGTTIAGLPHWAIAFERDFGTDHDIVVSFLNGVAFVGQASLSFLESDYGDEWFQDQIEPSIDVTEAGFQVAYAEQFGSSTIDYDIFASTLWFNGTNAVLAEAHVPLAWSGSRESAPQVASSKSGGCNGCFDDAAVVWGDAQLAPNLGDIEAATLYGSYPPPLVLCEGDGSSVPCPCSAGDAGKGCPNSVFPGGAKLIGSGGTFVSSDTLLLIASDLPNSTAVFVQAENGGTPSLIDDGITCVGGAVIRLGSRTVVGNLVAYPRDGDQPISVRGAIPASAGVTRVYQVFYRNAATFCTSATSNRTNALRLTWLP